MSRDADHVDAIAHERFVARWVRVQHWGLLVGLCLLWPMIANAADPLRERIDREVAAVWAKENVTPAPLSSDSEFLRRVYLDLCGTVPTYDEAVAFLGDQRADKRSQLIERLLADPRFAQQQADQWDMILFGRKPSGYDTDKRDGIQKWLRQQFAENRPYNVWVRELLKAEGNSVDHGPPTYWMQWRNQPEDASEAVSQTFLGVQLQCARCHDHPFEEWTQLDFYGMAAFLSRMDVVKVGKHENLSKFAIAEKSSGDILFTGPAKSQMPGKKGDPVPPKFLLGEVLVEPALPEGFKEVKFEENKPPQPPLFSRKDQLAEWVTREENPYFARAISNRIWSQFLGRGLVHPVDNMSPSNPATHPELLDAIARELVDHKFDLKWLIQEILNSRAYQLSSAGSTGEALPRWFQHGRTRPLSAEELVASWRVASGYDAALELSNKKPEGGRFHPLTGGYVLQFFGQPHTGTGEFQGGLQEHLYLNNGQLGQLINDSKGSLYHLLKQPEMTSEQRVERLFLQMLNRPPSDAEQRAFADWLDPAHDPRGEQLKDALWALMTCSEFRFNH